MEALIKIIEPGVSYVVSESIIVIKDIFRRYPNRYESVIKNLCQDIESIVDNEAKASLIWIIGQYSDRIQNAAELLEYFMQKINQETVEIQLSLLTAIVKLFIKRPTAGQNLCPKILSWATDQVDDPDLRDRGFIYWRLLSTDPVLAKAIILGEKPTISTEMETVDDALLDELLLHVASLSSVYHKPVSVFIGDFKTRTLVPSPALVVGRRFAKVYNAK